MILTSLLLIEAVVSVGFRVELKRESAGNVNFERGFILFILLVSELCNEFLSVAFEFDAYLDEQGIGKFQLLPVFLLVGVLYVEAREVNSSGSYVPRCSFERVEAIPQALLAVSVQAQLNVGKALIE